MSRLLVLLVVSGWVTCHVWAAVSLFTDDCPDGYGKGESWYPKRECGRCDCLEGGYGYACYTCGTYSIDYNETACYVYTETEKLYPECCKPILKCLGEEGFDEKLLIG